ncbi:ABC transporter substrate-binding protein [Variovorax saccharolyticus]|uniref:ABC transporter substrate-binding protein n=1 Tax=Variovorax saccharolyticus TaxID=3053516 RepID=UPI00257900FD|nr:ABC transporter substrate-binding protein [Variovorax sp. J31P216]MDM0026275.1 ABC transporter substrate-binding protein [Variovorax sp. J31P216]
MKRRTVLGTPFALALLQGSQRTGAAESVLRLGWVTAQDATSLAPMVAALRASLARLGYVEGRNLVIEFRYGDGAAARVPELVAELQRLPIDILLAQGGPAVDVVNGLPVAVPVAYVFSGDPVSAGFAKSLARPDSNMTGLTLLAAEMNGKLLEILREMVPSLRDVAIVLNPEHPGSHIERDYTDGAASQLGLRTAYFPARTRDEMASSLEAMAASPARAVSIFSDSVVVTNRRQILDFAIARKMPVMSGWPIFADSGALCTYGPRLVDSYARLASYVDRMAKGAKPADLPIERPTTFELVLNLRTANAIGLELPRSLLVRADRLIS